MEKVNLTEFLDKTDRTKKDWMNLLDNIEKIFIETTKIFKKVYVTKDSICECSALWIVLFLNLKISS